MVTEIGRDCASVASLLQSLKDYYKSFLQLWTESHQLPKVSECFIHEILWIHVDIVVYMMLNMVYDLRRLPGWGGNGLDGLCNTAMTIGGSLQSDAEKKVLVPDPFVSDNGIYAPRELYLGFQAVQ